MIDILDSWTFPEWKYLRTASLRMNETDKFQAGRSVSQKFDAFSYLVREYDNRVASVVIEKDMFLFGVWDLTEDEFLEKFTKAE
ncbi:hypothetical protein GCK72_000578 [Caenorhabditis remanei]|uniref:Uncharacterized protein n=1 Tax=Caenorhabditis remanei TaxID=31234 RepID=A0A6A5HMG4_CAERE|nr:hypothetical protein GCK72_000578 [Caenorhabditis remanei]KAF1768765.1 hypothetical protein GCK72_000578 [Caenorhabditis remanei]